MTLGAEGSRRTRVVALAGVLLFALRIGGCQTSGEGTAPDTPGAFAGAAGVPGIAGGAGVATAGMAGAGGMAGTGGALGACNAVPGLMFGPNGLPIGCGPPISCVGNSVVRAYYCDQTSCIGPSAVHQATACGASATCVGNKCFTRNLTPKLGCTSAVDCSLPQSVCAGPELMSFSDPTCDEGECHWKQLLNICAVEGRGNVGCTEGRCNVVAMQTSGGLIGMPSVDPMQPPMPPAQACTKAVDCPQPPPICFRPLISGFLPSDFGVSYVNPACLAGACVWQLDLTECSASCTAGACAPAGAGGPAP